MRHQGEKTMARRVPGGTSVWPMDEIEDEPVVAAGEERGSSEEPGWTTDTWSGSKVPPLNYPIALRLLKATEESELAARARRGDMEARQAMMEANIRLVMSIARRYSCKSLSFEDLVQEGIIGLLEAINKFDGDRGNRFSTYATYWIRQSLVRAIEKQDRLIRLPVYGCDAARKLERAQRVFAAQGRADQQ